MRLNWLKLLVISGFLFAVYPKASSQVFSFNCTRDTILPGCPPNLCFTLKALIPDIKGLSTSYSLNPGSTIPGCFPVYLNPDDPAGTPTNLVIDDRYSSVINLSFPFTFYGSVYNSLVVSTNGYLSFDISRAGATSHWQNNGDLPNGSYDRALIMGPYHDLDPSVTTSPLRRLQYQEWGVAPARRWVLSYFKMPLFGSACNALFENTHQIILYESTGIIEVKIFDKEICTAWNGGKAMVGIQDFSRTQGMTAPNRRMSDPPWGSIGMNETWRFVPDAGASLLKRVELYDGVGTLIATGTTAPFSNGVLEASFPNICPPAGATTTYIVRSVYQKIDDPAVEVFGSDTIRVNRLNPLAATVTPTAASCGTPDGIITVTGVSGGTPPYEYSLDGVTWQSSNVFTGLSAGNYTVYIRDMGAVCTMNVPVTVGVTGTISAATTTTATACTGVNNGTITVTSAGGTGPYTFSLDGGAPVGGTIPFTFNNVAAGSHTVIVYDAGTGCNSGPLTVNVAIGAGVSGTATTTPTACPGVSSGTITVTALTGTPPFQWSLDGGAFVPGASPYTFTNVSAGSHNVTIRDANNCTILVVANVAFGAGVAGNATSTATSCPGNTDGTITVTATAGTAPFTWSLDGGAPQSGASPYTFNNVAAGSHTVQITDAIGCNILVPVTVSAGATPTAVASSTATACAGVNNGTITITSASGPAPYTFSLDGGAPQAGTIPFTFSNVPAGVHTVVVTDGSGCQTAPISVTVATGPGVSGNATTTATSCPAASNGSITVDATAGTAPFTYQLDGGAPQSGANPYTFNNVAAGPHTIIITDNFGCTLTLSNVMVNAGPVLTANLVPTATSCAGATNGSITVTPVGGAAPFTFSLDGGAPQAGTPPYVFNNVPAGNHTIEVVDGAGCATGSLSVTVAAGPVLTTTVTATDVLCNGGSTGIITVTVPTIGTPPYEYSLDNVNWQSSNIFSGLAAGTYTVYFRESNGCLGQQSVTVNEPAVLSATSSVVNVSCNGGNDATVTITGGGGVTPYEYSIDNGTTWQSSATFGGLTAGGYTIIIRDANLCTATLTATVAEPAVLSASAATTPSSCNGGNDGTITVTATGGNSGGYQYSIDGVNFQASSLFNVVAGNYTVTVRDNLGCSFTFPVTVTLGNNLTFTPQTDPTICEGSSTQLNLVSNATVYTWTPSAGLSDPAIPNPVANPVVTTQYIVTATLDLCSITDTVIVNVNPAPVPDAGPPGFICYGQSYQLQGSGGVQYSWTPATYLNNTAVPNPIANAAQTITYTLSVVADVNGCPSLTTDTVTVDVTPPIKIYTYPADTIAYPGDQFEIKAVSTVPSANIFSWSPAFNLSDPNIYNPVLTAGNVGDSLIYKVTASSMAGCIGEAYVRLRVYKGPEIYVPTAFTPNGDGKNDRFYPFPVGIKAINYFRVFNRWGQLVFSSNTLYRGWDGKLQGVDQPAGVYVWMAQGIDKNNKVISHQGTVTLIR